MKRMKIKNKNKNKRKKYESYYLYKIPFIKDINEYILNIHKEMNHQSFEYLRKEFIKREIYYHGITSDIKNSLSECEICKLKSIKLTKLKDVSKIIIFDKPKMRYVGDLTNIPLELKQNTKFNYIFTIVDHFSKLANSYLLENKNKESILLNLKKFFEFYGPPQQFGCDNGREFVNNLVSSYLESKHIKIVHGAPYAP